MCHDHDVSQHDATKLTDSRWVMRPVILNISSADSRWFANDLADIVIETEKKSKQNGFKKKKGGKLLFRTKKKWKWYPRQINRVMLFEQMLNKCEKPVCFQREPICLDFNWSSSIYIYLFHQMLSTKILQNEKVEKMKKKFLEIKFLSAIHFFVIEPKSINFS